MLHQSKMKEIVFEILIMQYTYMSSITMIQRAMTFTELRTVAGFELEENASAQCRPSRIKKDDTQMTAHSAKIDEFCNPFT